MSPAYARSIVERHRFVSPTALFLVEDNDGTIHWGTTDPPLRTIIDIHGLPFGKWLKLHEGLGRVTITLDNKTVVYQRVGCDLHGYWICDLVT